MQKCLLQNNCKNALQRAQSKLKLGLKHKKELKSEIDCLVLNPFITKPTHIISQTKQKMLFLPTTCFYLVMCL